MYLIHSLNVHLKPGFLAHIKIIYSQVFSGIRQVSQYSLQGKPKDDLIIYNFQSYNFSTDKDDIHKLYSVKCVDAYLRLVKISISMLQSKICEKSKKKNLSGGVFMSTIHSINAKLKP